MMFDEDQNKKKGDDPKKPPGGLKMPSASWLPWIAIIGSIGALMLVKGRMGAQDSTLKQAVFFQKYESNPIAQATINYNLQSGNLIEIVGTYYETEKDGSITKKDGKPVLVPFTTKALLTEKMKDILLPPAGKLEVSETSPMLLKMIWTVAPFLLIGIFFWFFSIRFA